MSDPKVSILIPCFNAERWIRQAIQSALDQEYPHKEVVVVDDGSTDASLDIVRSFGAAIRWETGPNRGGNRARNRLLGLSLGTWLQYLDADDYLLPTKVSGQMEYIKTAPECDVVYGPSLIETVGPTSGQRITLVIPEPHDPWTLLARWFLPQTGAALWRKQAIVDVGGWKEDQPCCQEHELYLRLLIGGKQFAYHSTTGAVYRQWSEETVCKRDKPEVRRRRLEIEAKAEQFLASSGELTDSRAWAINMARFEMARIAWQIDRTEARRILSTVREGKDRFVPKGDAAPTAYACIYRMLGFDAAEKMADARRKWGRS